MSPVMGKTAVLAELEGADRVLVISHRDPDGDALGSTLGLMHLLAAKGKTALGFSAGPIPPEYRFLPGLDMVSSELPPKDGIDLAVLLDCHEPRRAGDAAQAFLEAGVPAAVIDHHRGEAEFGQAAWVEPDYAATSEMIADMALEAGWALGAETATCLFVGLQTDTGSFRYANSSPRAFRLAGELVAAGADPWAVSQQVYATRPKRLLLLARILDGMETAADGRLALGQVTLADLDDLEADPRDMEDAVEALRGLPGVEAAALLRELPGGGAKVSMRSRGRVDVAEVAMALGGGGHKNAAGLRSDDELPAVRDEIRRRLLAGLGETS